MTKDKKLELVGQLQDIFEELGWVFSVPVSDEPIQGMIVGEVEYVTDVIRAYYGDDVEITTASELNDGEPILNLDKTKH